MAPHLKSLAVLTLIFIAIARPEFALAAPAEPATQPAITGGLAGTWLVESSSWDPATDIVRAKLTVTGNNFALIGYRGLDRAWTGTFLAGVDGDARNLDLHTNEYDIARAGGTLVVPASAVHCIYKIERSPDGDRLTICYSLHADQPRPNAFVEPEQADDNRVVTLVRAAPDFTDFSKEVILTALDPQGNPDANASVFVFMQYTHPFVSRDNGKTQVADMTSPARWGYLSLGKTGSDGTFRLPFSDFEQQFKVPTGVRDPNHNWIAFTAPSAAALQYGKLIARLQPVREIRAQVACSALALPSKGAFFYPTASLYWHDNDVASNLAYDGTFVFTVPPGTYRLAASCYNTYMHRQLVTVPAGSGPFVLSTIELDASVGIALIGKSAPPLTDIVAWKNGPVDLASLKGKLVLLNFWGYWCGGCVIEMPTLMHLHDKYQDRGLAVVTIHVDAGGEVDTVQKLQQRTAIWRNGIWNGRDLPFPVALTSGRPFGHSRCKLGATFGVLGYPTTIVIGRDGKIMGEAGNQVPLDLTADEKTVDPSIEKLLVAK